MNVPAELRSGPWGAIDSAVVQSPTLRVSSHLRLAAVLSESNPDGLQHMVDVGGQGLCEAPEKFGVTEAIVTTGVEQNHAEGAAPYRWKFQIALEALYRCQRKPLWIRLNMIVPKVNINVLVVDIEIFSFNIIIWKWVSCHNYATPYRTVFLVTFHQMIIEKGSY